MFGFGCVCVRVCEQSSAWLRVHGARIYLICERHASLIIMSSTRQLGSLCSPHIPSHSLPVGFDWLLYRFRSLDNRKKCCDDSVLCLKCPLPPARWLHGKSILNFSFKFSPINLIPKRIDRAENNLCIIFRDGLSSFHSNNAPCNLVPHMLIDMTDRCQFQFVRIRGENIRLNEFTSHFGREDVPACFVTASRLIYT